MPVRRGTLFVSWVVAGIILLTAGAIGYGVLSRTDFYKYTAQCRSQARVTAICVRVYAMCWNGWVHPDPNYYLRHPVAPFCTGTEYGEMRASGGQGATRLSSGSPRPSCGDSIVCPLDASPERIAPDLVTSYEVIPHIGSFGPGSGLSVPVGQIPVVFETGCRHLSFDGTEKLKRFVVFADICPRLLDEDEFAKLNEQFRLTDGR